MEATTGVEEFKMTECYHGDLRQEFLTNVLVDDGDFLIRRTSESMNVITVKWNKRHRNYKPDYDGETYR